MPTTREQMKAAVRAVGQGGISSAEFDRIRRDYVAWHEPTRAEMAALCAEAVNDAFRGR